jgi:hypothetical protein
MKFLIDGHKDRVLLRQSQWFDGVGGQLLTPLTRYRRGSDVFAIDNGCFTSFREKEFVSLLKREYEFRESALFVCSPDKVGCHKTTFKMYEDYHHLCAGFKIAFVAQDGYEGMPNEVDALFIGGTNAFKDSQLAVDAVIDALNKNKHVHIGRINTAPRFLKFNQLGAHTCDGSGVSRYDHMLPAIKVSFELEQIMMGKKNV